MHLADWKFLFKPSRTHLYLTWVWVGFAIPTVLWWHSSILWVSLASIYANVVTHWGAYEAACAEEQARKTKQLMLESNQQSAPGHQQPDHYPWSARSGDENDPTATG